MLSLAVVGALAAALSLPGAATAVGSSDATVIDLPTGVRSTPRGVWPIGRTTDGHTVFDGEQDPLYGSGGFTEHKIVSSGGAVTTLDQGVETVVGNRLVQTHTDTTVTSRLVSAASWATKTVPAGYTVLDYTTDGIVVRTGTQGSHVIGLLPWDSDVVLTVAGLPAGASYYPYEHGVHDGSWGVLSAGIPGGDPNGGAKLVVDTSALKAWPVQTSNADCPVYRSFNLSVNDGVLAWSNQLDDLSYVLCTTPLPAPAAASVAATTDRPMPRLPDEAGNPQSYDVLAAGDDVLISSRDAIRTWGTVVGQPILAVAPNGTYRALASSGHGVIPGAPGHVVAVTGAEPGQASLRDLDVAAGTSTEVMPMEPVGAWYTSIAIDGSTVVYSDDSAQLGGARRRTVDFGAGTAGPTTLLDDDVTGPVATGQGVTAWGKSGYQGKWSTVLQADDTRITSNSYRPLWAEPGWVRFQGSIMQLPSGTVTNLASTVAFQDGITYKPGATVSGAAANSVVATDVLSHEASAITVPECTAVGDVQVAGSWLYVNCPTSPTTDKMVVVDRTGVVPTHTISTGGVVYLGNGFAIRRSGTSLSWTSLSTPTPNWVPLGNIGSTTGDEAAYSVSVSRGSIPTAAWFSGREGHVALFPVTASPLPPRPATPTVASTSLPVISGTPKVNFTLTASNGTWSPAGTYTYQWYASGVLIPDATLGTYSPTGADVGKQIRVAVTASKVGYNSASALSAATTAVAAGTFENWVLPTISGTARVGARLDAQVGTWRPAGSYAYQWYANDLPISGATGSSYVPTAPVRGKLVNVRVTASKPGYDSMSAFSGPTVPVGYGSITNSKVPRISGTRRVGRTLTAAVGTWSPNGLVYSYRWLRDGRAITGATGKAYKLTRASKGHRISVRVTAKRTGYATLSKTSPSSTKIT